MADDPADESIDGRIREILASAKACRSEREMKAARAIYQEAVADARRQAVEEVSAWLTHKRGCMAKYVLADGRHCTCDCGLAALLPPAPRSGG